MSDPQDRLRLRDFTLAPRGSGFGLRTVNFDLEAGDICTLEADAADDAHLFLRALATLETPLAGTFDFNGQRLDFSDYRHLLAAKRRIGYIAADSALLSNRSIRENLLYARFFFENSLELELTEAVVDLCRRFHLKDKLQWLPDELNAVEKRVAVTIRELAAAPDLILFESPEEHLGQAHLDTFLEIIAPLRQGPTAMVFSCESLHCIDSIANRQLRLEGGQLVELTGSEPPR